MSQRDRPAAVLHLRHLHPGRPDTGVDGHRRRRLPGQAAVRGAAARVRPQHGPARASPGDSSRSWRRGGSRGRCSRSRASAGCPGTEPRRSRPCPSRLPGRCSCATCSWGRRGRGDHRPGLRQPARRPRRAVLLRARLHPRRPRLRPRRRRPGRGGARRRAAARARGARGRGRRRARRDGRRRRPLPRRPDRPAAGRRGSPARTARRPPRSSCARCWRPRAAVRAARHGQVRRRGRGARGRTHDARGDRPPGGRSPRCWPAGDTACAMEVSSHALELRRADGIHFAAAVFTNLTQDHLDFHPDMEAYFQAKRLLFAAGPGVRIANADDPYGRAPGGRVRRHGDLRDRRRRRLPRRRRARRAARARRSSCARRTASSPTAVPLPGRVQRRQRARPRGRRRGRWASRPSVLARGAAATPAPSRGASSPSTRGSRSRCSSTTRTRPTRSRTCCVAARDARRAAA